MDASWHDSVQQLMNLPHVTGKMESTANGRTPSNVMYPIFGLLHATVASAAVLVYRAPCSLLLQWLVILPYLLHVVQACKRERARGHDLSTFPTPTRSPQ